MASSNPVNQAPKKPLIFEVIGKTIPNFEIKDLGHEISIVFNVEEEDSAKNIDLDVSETAIKLSSTQ